MSHIVVYNPSGVEQERIDMNSFVLAKEVSPKTYTCAVNALLQNWRQGTVSCKARGDVAFSNKKPWKQKGTGRARAGSARSPIWRKGGVTFGPQPRTRTLSINKKQVKLVLNNILQTFLSSDKNNVFCLDLDISKEVRPNTKMAFNALKSLDLQNKKVVLFVPFEDELGFASFRNIPNVNMLSFSQPNAYDLTNCDGWVFFKKDIDLFKKMVSSWN